MTLTAEKTPAETAQELRAKFDKPWLAVNEAVRLFGNAHGARREHYRQVIRVMHGG